MSRINEMTAIAASMGLSPRDAVALPTVITVAARKVGMSEAAMRREISVNRGLAAYLANACRVAAAAL